MTEYQASATAGPRCSALSRRVGEPMAGTASQAVTWLCVEQPGPWGRDAVLESHLDAEVGRELTGRTTGTGIRVALIRRAGSHPDRHTLVPHRIYLAHTAPGRTWLERAWVADPKELLDLDFRRLAAGEPSGLGHLVDEPLVLVCTNGRRDVCCALLGRPVAAALAEGHGEQVWECSHLGGHRFSPTALALPHGYSYGRLDVAAAARLLDRRTGVLVEHCRGRSTWPPAGQVAELAVRAATGDRDSDSVWVAEPLSAQDGRSEILVSHVDGRRWVVVVAERAASPDLRSASCAAAPTAVVSLHADEIRELTTG